MSIRFFYASGKYCLLLFFVLFAFIACKNNNSSGKRKSSSNPNSIDTVSNLKLPKPNYNIYIENSGSMDGYVSTESDFKNSVYGIATKLLSKEIANKISLNFVSDKICEYRSKALPEDIKKFIYDLNSIKKLNKEKCDVVSTDFSTLIKNVVSKNEGDVDILISDCILSFKGGTDQYLLQQQNSINILLAPLIKKQGFSTIILKLNSQFKGRYYIESKNGVGIDINSDNFRRPYYILIFGKLEKINMLLSSINFSEFKGFENSYYLFTPSENKPSAKIIRNNLIGRAEIEQPASSLIINNVRSSNRTGQEGVFQFSIAMNLENFKMDDSYLRDISNYEVSENYSIVSISKNTDIVNESLKGYTHVFLIKTEKLVDRQDVFIKLRSQMPNWVGSTTNRNDSDPIDSIQQTQTFGLKYIIQGIDGAYKDNYNEMGQFITTIKISMNNYNSHGSSNKFSLWWIVLLISIVSVVIWLKNKK